MYAFLCRHLIRDAEHTQDPTVRRRYAKCASLTGIFVNALLCAVKLLAGILTGSIAVIADGVNNLADSASSVLTLVGFRLAAQPEDEKHPYGHARYEYLTGMVISLLILLVGGQLASSSVQRILHPAPPVFRWSVIVILVLSILLKLWLAQFYRFTGKRIDALALLAAGTDSRNDVVATAAVLLSTLLGQHSTFPVDGWMGLLVALFILWSGIRLMQDTASPLLGEAPDPALVAKIREMALAAPGVLGIHDLTVHNYGPGKYFASLHVEVPASGDLLASHDMVDDLERAISEALSVEITAHLDPIQTDDPLVQRMRALVCQVADAIPGVLEIHDLRLTHGPSHANVIFDAVVDDARCPYTHEALQAQFTDAIRQTYPHVFVIINFDRPYVR